MKNAKTRLSLPTCIGVGVTTMISAVVVAYAVSTFSREDSVAYIDTTSQIHGSALSESDATTSMPRVGFLDVDGNVAQEGEQDNVVKSLDFTEGDVGRSAEGDSSSSNLRGPRPISADQLRARTIAVIAAELFRRRGLSRGFSGSRAGLDEEAPDEEEEPEYASIRKYLTDIDELPDDVRGVVDILNDPSNIVSEGDAVNLVAWDIRYEEPIGSYLYVLQQDVESNISQVHRYFCPQRRLDILAETCVPVASVFSNAGEPVAVGYTEDGLPIMRDAGDLDPERFSRGTTYVEANEFLFYLQEYFDSMRV